MCKNSAYLVKKPSFIHNPSTLDEKQLSVTVEWGLVFKILCKFFHKLIHAKFCFYKKQINGFTRFPQSLLLLLLSIKLNIIIKNQSNGVSK